MKIIVEIKDDSFKWAYKIGESEQKGETCLTSESFLAFAQILQICQHAMDSNAREELDKIMSEVGAKAYMSKNINESISYLEGIRRKE